ncbi:MAG: Lsr2 family protein [Actinomycetota bacterium]|nr:Lsr2 family protein [Actinomycetota bacterium]
MAQKVQVILVDDVDGGDAEETVSFSLDGVAYEIDVSADNAARLREALAPYVGVARRIGGRSGRGSGGGSGGGRGANRGGAARGGRSGESSTSDIRQWARDNGYTVPDRGRLPGSIVEAYNSAHA